MTAPEFSEQEREEWLKPHPSDAFAEEDFGPDHAAPLSTEDIARQAIENGAPKQNRGKRAPRATESVLGNLGQNTKRNSGIRQLTKDDQEQIATAYTFFAAGIMPFRMKTAQAIAESADNCAAAWVEMSKKNDRIRKWILGALEGGALGALVFAHFPILVSLMPENMSETLSGMIANASPFRRHVEDDGSEHGGTQ